MLSFKELPILLLILTGVVFISGCNKYLDAKPDNKLVVPAAVADVQATLDYYYKVNNTGAYPCESSADDYYLTDSDWASISDLGFRRMYLWEKDHLFTFTPNTWAELYDLVYIANNAIYSLSNIPKEGNNITDWNNAKGQALYLRAQSFLQAASIWSLAYDPGSASTDLGIPLRLDPDFNKPSVRASVQQTYDQIITDLKASIPLLPQKPLHVLRASRPAAYALLARTYLFMRDYHNAGLYADSCLQINDKLMDYNNLPPTSNYPFEQFNEEVIAENQVPIPINLTRGIGKIDPILYASYHPDDLRKTLFFSANSGGTFGFKGSYEGANQLFGGIATDEVYLIRAECSARSGNTAAAIDDLNKLLTTRWSNTVVYPPVTASDPSDALRIILLERRKELVFRCLRWMDIKRLNKEGANIILTRTINGKTHTLAPNDLRYALPIPEDVIALSGMTQNLR